MTVGIRASVAMCGSCLKDTMSSSHVEEVAEAVWGRDLDPLAKGRGKKDKSRDPLTSLDSRVTRLEIAMADTKEGVDLMEQSMEKVVEDLMVQIQDLQEGMLEALDMNENEILFNLMENLQGWAEQELRRRGVQDLGTTMAIAESLMDFRRGDSS